MCDCLVALPAVAADGVTRFAKNSDRPAGEVQRIEWHPPVRSRTVRATYIEVAIDGEPIGVLGSRPEWMWGFEHGVNEAGVAVGNETIYTTLDPRPFPPALTGMDLVRLALSSATTASEAVETVASLLERYGQGGSGHRDVDRPYWSSFLVADPGTAFVVETSGRDLEVERVDAARAISNRTTIPSFDAAHRHPRQPVEKLVDPRLDASRSVLERGAVTTAALQAHLRSHAGGSDGWTICMHVGGTAPEATTAAIVAELPQGGPFVARMLVGSPCTSVFVPLVVGQPVGPEPDWNAVARLPAVARDELEARLAEELRVHDPRWNAHAFDVVRVACRRGGARTAP